MKERDGKRERETDRTNRKDARAVTHLTIFQFFYLLHQKLCSTNWRLTHMDDNGMIWTCIINKKKKEETEPDRKTVWK